MSSDDLITWIDIEYRLPPHLVPLWVMDENGVVMGARYDNGVYYFDGGEGTGNPVAYWREK